MAERSHPLPPPESGWFAQAYAVDTGRHLLRLSASVDLRAWLEAARKDAKSWPEALATLTAGDTRMRIEAFADGDRVDDVAFPLETLFPEFDRLPDGRWVVANARSQSGELNARILASDGSLQSRIALGDGIARLQCDRMGGIWVSFFDEGIGGGPNSDPDVEPPGAFGINRFRPDGSMSWSPGRGLYPPIYDCYAMTVAEDGVWLYYYDGFPIVHVPFDGVLRQWRNDAIRGASLIAADGELAVLLGGYQEENDMGALLALCDDGHSEVLRRFRLDPALQAAMGEGLACARGDEIHFVAEDRWTVISIADFVAGNSREVGTS